MASFTFRGLLNRIAELERQRMGKRYVPGFWNFTIEQREDPVIAWWLVKKPGLPKWEFGWMMQDIFFDAMQRSGHHRCGHHGIRETPLTRHKRECIPYYDRCALEAFKESEPFLAWWYEVMAWDDHDGRFWSLIEQGEAIRAWFGRYITPTMCPDWSEPRGYIAKRLSGEPIPYEVLASMPLPSVEAVHQKRLEHWRRCQKYGSEPQLKETVEYMQRRFGDGCDDGA